MRFLWYLSLLSLAARSARRLWGARGASLARRIHQGGELDSSHPRRPVKTVALVGLLVLAGAVVGAVPARAGAGTIQVDRVKARHLAAEVSGLDGRIDSVVTRYARATEALRAVRQQIADNKRLQFVAENELGVARTTLAVRAVSLYKRADVSSLDALFTAADFDQLIDQETMLRSLARGDREVLHTVVDTKQELADQAVSLVADRKTVEKLVAARRDEVKGIRAELAARRGLLRGVRSAIRGLVTKMTEAAPPPRSGATPTSGGNIDGHGPWWMLIRQSAAANGVDPHGMYRLMMIESGGSASAVGPGGYYGLFQYALST